MSYEIQYLQDESDCETCGPTYANGYIILKDGEKVVDKTPCAACYSSLDYYDHSPYKDIAELEGIEIKEVVAF